MYNSHSGGNSMSALAGASMSNPVPLPGRPLSGGRERDNRMNPAAVKKTMFKPMPTSQMSDRSTKVVNHSACEHTCMFKLIIT